MGEAEPSFERSGEIERMVKRGVIGMAENANFGEGREGIPGVWLEDSRGARTVDELEVMDDELDCDLASARVFEVAERVRGGEFLTH